MQGVRDDFEYKNNLVQKTCVDAGVSPRTQPGAVHVVLDPFTEESCMGGVGDGFEWYLCGCRGPRRPPLDHEGLGWEHLSEGDTLRKAPQLGGHPA